MTFQNKVSNKNILSYSDTLSENKRIIFSSLFDSLIESGKDEDISFTVAKSIVEHNLQEREDGKTFAFTNENFEEIVTIAPKHVKDFSKISNNVINILESELPTTTSFHCPVIGDLIPILESDFDEETKRAKVTLIQAGWSKNMNYYSPSVLEQIVPFVKEQPKIFVNHTEVSRFGRSLDDWGATVESVNFVRDGKKSRVEAILTFEGALQGEKMMNAVIHQPKEIGLSINTIAEISQGTRDGKTGRIVEKWVKYHSTDFVHGPSAGGKIQAVFASQGDADLSVLAELIENMHSLADRYERDKEFENFFLLTNLLTWLIIETSRTSDVDESEKKKHISQLVGEFEEKLNTIDLNRAFPPFGEIGEAENKEATDMEVAKMTLAVLEQENPNLVRDIADRAVEELESGKAVADMTKDLKVTKESLGKVEGELEKATNDLKETKTKLEESEKAKGEAEVKLAGFEEAKAREEKSEFIEKAINDSKYPGGAGKYPEFYKNQLFETESEDDIKTAIDNLATLALTGTGKPVGSGVTSPAIETEDNPSTEVAESNDEAAKLFNN